MAIDPVTMMMIAQGVNKGVQSGSRLLQPNFQNSRYGRLLRQKKDQGNLTPGQEANVLGRTATTATKQANLANKRYTGALINQGIQGSVSAQRGLREAEADVRRTVADTGKDIYQSEEEAKSKAKLDYARGIDQDKSERFKAGLGVFSAGVETFANLQGKKAQEQQATDKSYIDAVAKGGDARAITLPSGKTGYIPLDAPKGVEKFLQEYSVDNDPGKLFGKLLESGMSRESAKDLMRFYAGQELKKPNIDIMSPQYRVNPYRG
tara:strand:- start:196 stop:987 length:792 start_codon:yes stop_codon:yes gene_type:complete